MENEISTQAMRMSELYRAQQSVFEQSLETTISLMLASMTVNQLSEVPVDHNRLYLNGELGILHDLSLGWCFEYSLEPLDPGTSYKPIKSFDLLSKLQILETIENVFYKD